MNVLCVCECVSVCKVPIFLENQTTNRGFSAQSPAGCVSPPKVYRNLIEMLLLDGFLGTQV